MNFLTQSSVKFPQTHSEARTDKILAHHAECNDDWKRTPVPGTIILTALGINPVPWCTEASPKATAIQRHTEVRSTPIRWSSTHLVPQEDLSGSLVILFSHSFHFWIIQQLRIFRLGPWAIWRAQWAVCSDCYIFWCTKFYQLLLVQIWVTFNLKSNGQQNFNHLQVHSLLFCLFHWPYNLLNIYRSRVPQNQSRDPSSSEHHTAIIFVITNEALLNKQRNVVPLKCTSSLTKGNPLSCSGYLNWMALWLQHETGTWNAAFSRTMCKIIFWNGLLAYFRHQSV